MMWEEETIMKTDCFRKKNAGFTLAELLMVIVIIGVLGSIAIPRFFPQKEKAVVAEAVNMMGAIRQGEIAYRLEHTGYVDLGTGDTWDVIGIDNPNSETGKFNYTVTKASASSATITATRNSTDAKYNGKTITLSVADGSWDGTHPFRPKS
jgi:prepilin-type N-terminal cleavage/methylation domain-containing protein